MIIKEMQRHIKAKKVKNNSTAKIKCYKCDKEGHYASNCSLRRIRGKKKTKNLKCTWNDSEEEEEGETQYLALTGFNDEVHSSPSCSNSCQSSDEDDEHETMIKELHASLKYTLARNKELRAKNNALINANSRLANNLGVVKSSIKL